MNIVTVDPSLSCTAVVVNDKKFAFVNRELAFTKTGNLKKWFDITNELAELHFICYREVDNYSESELEKLRTYDETTSHIVDTILLNIDTKKDIQVLIEGYSFSSAAGPLIDLVTFSTLLRKKLYEHTEYLEIIAPTSLKLETAKLSYPPIQKGKKVIKYEYRNNQGIAGGSFKKPDMYRALIDNNALQNPYVSFLRDNAEEILNYKDIPKPIEDLNDAQLMYFIAANR